MTRSLGFVCVCAVLFSGCSLTTDFSNLTGGSRADGGPSDASPAADTTRESSVADAASVDAGLPDAPVDATFVPDVPLLDAGSTHDAAVDAMVVDASSIDSGAAEDVAVLVDAALDSTNAVDAQPDAVADTSVAPDVSIPIDVPADVTADVPPDVVCPADDSDQVLSPVTSGYGVRTGNWQTALVGRNGMLEAVVFRSTNGTPTSSTVRAFAGTGTAGTLLGMQTVSFSGGDVYVQFAPAIPVTAGARVTFSFEHAGIVNGSIFLTGAMPYPGNSSIDGFSGVDLWFTTYVTGCR